MLEKLDLKKLYWDGTLNKVLRFWFYLTKGIDIFNQFRYLFALFLGIYFTLKLTNGLWLVAMILVSLPLLILIGYFSVHHVGKVLDWLNVKFSTHYSLHQITLLEEIRDSLKDKMNA